MTEAHNSRKGIDELRDWFSPEDATRYVWRLLLQSGWREQTYLFSEQLQYFQTFSFLQLLNSEAYSPDRFKYLSPFLQEIIKDRRFKAQTIMCFDDMHHRIKKTRVWASLTEVERDNFDLFCCLMRELVTDKWEEHLPDLPGLPGRFCHCLKPPPGGVLGDGAAAAPPLSQK